MENGPVTSPRHSVCNGFIRSWLALTGREVRLLQAGDVTTERPALFAISHPPVFLHALVLTTAIDPPIRCLLPSNLARGPLGQFIARCMGIILYEGDQPNSEAILQEAIEVLAGGGGLAVFADPTANESPEPGALTSTAAMLAWRSEAEHPGQRLAVHPVHLFLPESAMQSREILIYVDSPLAVPEGESTPPSSGGEMQSFAETLESRFRENAFQLRPADLEYFLTDLEDILRTDLQEDWASRPEWKQDTDGFVLSRLLMDWAKQTNYLDPGRLVALRQSVEDYRRVERRCALRELQVHETGSLADPGWRRVLYWLEALLGLPLALYGLVNHLVIGLVLFLAGSFKPNNSRARSKEWTLRGALILGIYIIQIYLVAHWLGRAAAGYYAPSLPVAGAYLWRYWRLVRPQIGLLFISLTIPRLTRKVKRLRHDLLEGVDRALEGIQ